jgi:hypothetical protein
MSFEATVAVPFRERGSTRLGEGAFVVALANEHGWFTADQAKRLVDLAVGEGLLVRDGRYLVAEFDPRSVSVPDEFSPDESILRERSTFERVLDALVTAGIDKQEAVAGINARQRDLDVTIEAAAILYACGRDVDVTDAAARARAELAERGER